jgi:hypothetical protein
MMQFAHGTGVPIYTGARSRGTMPSAQFMLNSKTLQLLRSRTLVRPPNLPAVHPMLQFESTRLDRQHHQDTHE